MKVIREQKANGQTRKGVYQNSDGSFLWITFSRSGVCSKLSTAMKKAGF